jgi:hypothetical protein
MREVLGSPSYGGLNASSSLPIVDRLTQAAATAISRRSAIKTGLFGGIATAFGVQLLTPVPAAATNCNRCWGQCSHCQSMTGNCCSPNGVYCHVGTCNCNSGCNCNCFQASLNVCDDGSTSGDCPCNCWFCYWSCGCGVC